MIETRALSLAMAKKMADAAEEKAIALKLKIAIAIMDNHGNLKYFRRMDGNGFISVRMAPLKALTSASMSISTKELALRNATLPNLSYLGIPGISLLEGGMPIVSKENEHLGAIGISGATPELDGICAEAALRAIEAAFIGLGCISFRKNSNDLMPLFLVGGEMAPVLAIVPSMIEQFYAY